MSKKRKFSLGDIIKKINEGKTSHDQDDTVHGQRDHGDEQRGFQKSVSDPVKKPQLYADDLPSQPDYSRSGPKYFPNEPLQQNKLQKSDSRGTADAQTASDSGTEKATVRESEPEKALTQPPAPATLPLSTDEGEEEEFDIGKYLSVIFRRKYIIAAVVFLMALHSGYSYLTSTRHYTAHARLLFRPEDKDVFSANQGSFTLFRSRDRMFYTHLDLLKSSSVLTMVSENLQKKVSPSYMSSFISVRRRSVDGQTTDMIDMSFRHSDSRLAADVLNELCRTYIDYRRDVDSREATRMIVRLEAQVNSLQTDLSKKEDRLRIFKEDNQMAALSSETNLVVSKLADMELALQTTRLQISENRERMVALQSQMSQQETEVVQSMTYQKPFQRRLEELELQLSSLLAKHSPEHFRVVTVMQQIENIKDVAANEITRKSTSETRVTNPIRQSLLQNYIYATIERSSLDTRRSTQEQIIERLNGELLLLPQMQQTYANLHRDTESTLQTLNLMRTRLEEAKIRRDSQESDLSVLEYAQEPRRSVSDYKLNKVFVNILIGLIFGICIAFLIEYLDQSIKDPSQMERDIGVPLLGIVPFIEAEKALVENSDEITKNVLEPFRALRANINHLIDANKLKTFMVCSAVKGEGKTTLAANLAITFAMDGKKVILIDADLRRSQLHQLFAIEKENGLSDYLMSQTELGAILKKTTYENLSVITSGNRPSNPAELIGTVKFTQLIRELRGEADIVLFDSPALLPVSDSLIMAPKMDSCLFVARVLWTPVKAAKQAKIQLSRIGTKIFGGILNGVSSSKGYYPYYGYYGYYSYKYSYEAETPEPFSIRKIGLYTENFIRQNLKNLIYSIPMRLAKAGSSIRDIGKKGLFYLLSAILIALFALNVWFSSREDEGGNEKIRYIGPLPGETSAHTQEKGEVLLHYDTQESTESDDQYQF